jgi:hypothetical protein
MSVPLPAHRPQPPSPAQPPCAERPGDTLAIGILTGRVVLGGLILLGLALTGLIWTPWQAFPAQTSAAGVRFQFDRGRGHRHARSGGDPPLRTCGPAAHLSRPCPGSKGPRTVFVTLLLVGRLVVGYVALALQIVLALTVTLTDEAAAD